ncbi:SIMPL domain-containing protein [Nitrosopumilus sp. K4]|uniref:SIMPL domain-containing protein n=1 Tax=Nitrosopumilus sp. K4 TaxID=2795383 RepID=UPI001BA7DB19|nr:SIMPL domain-containing protein [Nitrosopumilus sp. K4]QUC64310.1 SIMPL domain-containing protein [Nitrosopumilus sp. K4]
MKKSNQTIVAVIAVLVVSVSLSAAFNEADAEEITPFPSREKTISVSGQATLEVVPDLLTIRLGTETQEKTAQEALASNSEMMNKVISALKTAGVSEEEISTSSLNIHPVYESYKDERGDYRSKLVGYKVSNIISVETKNLDSAASIIDGAVSAGVNRIDSVYFSLSPEIYNVLKDQLLEEAVINAREKAEIALSPLDHKIIGIKSISLSEFSIPYPMPAFRGDFAMAESMAKSAPTPVFSSDQDVTTSAHVVFLIGSN